MKHPPFQSLPLGFCLFLIAVLTQPTLLAQPDRITGRAFATRSEVIAQHGMVATSHPLATQIGIEILKAGGSAVDAAIAANAALGLMEPVSCGIGGDLFALIWDAKSKKLHGLNASGRAPMGITLEGMRAEVTNLGRESIPPLGVLPITVPGAVDGWFELHGRFGRLPMAHILEPSIQYAENGHPVAELIAHYWNMSITSLTTENLPGSFIETFTVDGIRAPMKGEIFRNPALGRTYRQIATDGRDAFYRGEIADRMDAFFRQNGGFLRKRDFEQHTSTWVEPAHVNYRGYDIFQIPPPGQGIAVLQMLNILEAYDLRAMGFGSPEALHLMIEAKKLAFEDRAKFYADPTFSSVPLAKLLDKDYATERRALINPSRAAKTYDAGNAVLNEGDTIYLTTADSAGNMVSFIQSNYRGMGSGIAVLGLGFGFQDRGEQFSLDPNHQNAFAPGKRPFHTIIPGFAMKDGRPWLAFGVMGGSMQPQGHVQILVNLIDHQMSLQEAGDAPRWQHLGSSEPTGVMMKDGGYIELESSFPWETARELRNRGHQIRIDIGGFGGYQAILFDAKNGVYIGASESRKDGQAAGY